jgi:chromosome segregation ATPase
MIEASKLFGTLRDALPNAGMPLLFCHLPQATKDAWARVAEVASEPLVEAEELRNAYCAEYADLQTRHDGLVNKVDELNAQLDEARAEFAEFRQSVLNMLESSPDEFERISSRILDKIASFE